jgi:hypothetical protein
MGFAIKEDDSFMNAKYAKTLVKSSVVLQIEEIKKNDEENYFT